MDDHPPFVRIGQFDQHASDFFLVLDDPISKLAARIAGYFLGFENGSRT